MENTVPLFSALLFPPLYKSDIGISSPLVMSLSLVWAKLHCTSTVFMNGRNLQHDLSTLTQF